MSFGRDKQHPEPAALHAYAAGEVDPVERSSIRSHVEDCASCRLQVVQIEGALSLFADMGAVDLDDLSWRRLEQRVRTELDQPVPTRANVFHRMWQPVAMAGVVVAALLVWFAPRPGPVVRVATPVAKVNVPTLKSGHAPFELRLASGPQLVLSGHAQVRVTDETEDRVRLALDEGQLHVRLIGDYQTEGHVELVTPEFHITASAGDFQVGYWADEAYIDVVAGPIHVEGRSFSGRQILRTGERRIIRRPADPCEPGTAGCELAAPAERAAAPKPTPKRAQRVAPAAKTPGPKSEKAALDVPAAPTVRELESAGGADPSPATVEVTVEAPKSNTTVEVVAPDRDPLTVRYERAQALFYRENQAEHAITLAESIVTTGGERQEVALAWRLLCDAYIATSRPDDAVKACESVLATEPDRERQRPTHRLLASLYADQVGDCDKAIEHFSAVIVFGRASMLDDAAHIGRARCAIEVGNLELARRDIELLETRRNRLQIPAVLDDLIQSLRARDVNAPKSE